MARTKADYPKGPNGYACDRAGCTTVYGTSYELRMHHRNDHITLSHPMFCQECGKKCTGSSVLAQHFLDDHPQDATLSLWARYLSESPARYLPRDLSAFMSPPESVTATSASSSMGSRRNTAGFEPIPPRPSRYAHVPTSASSSTSGSEPAPGESSSPRVPQSALRNSEPLLHPQNTQNYDDQMPQTGWLCHINNCNTEHHSRRLLMKHQMMDHPNEPVAAAESVEEQSSKDPSLTFECRVEGCHKKFNCSSMLTRHKYTHEPPRFKCPHCSALLSRPDALTRHLKSSCSKVKQELFRSRSSGRLRASNSATSGFEERSDDEDYE